MPIPESTSGWCQAMITRLVGLTSPCSRITSTASWCPRPAAHARGVSRVSIQAPWQISQPSTSTSPKTISTISRMGAQCRPPDGQNLSRSRVYQSFFCLPSSQIALEQVILCDLKLLASRGLSNISRNIREKESGLGIRRGTR